MKRYWELFLRMGIPYGLGMGLLYAIKHRSAKAGLTAAIVMGSAFGILMSAFGESLQRRAVRRRVSQLTESALSVRQCRSLVVPLSYEAAFALGRSSLEVLGRCTIQQEDLSGGIIRVKTGMRWKSFGERITVTVRSLSGESTEIALHSQPILSTVMIDFGQNFDNIAKMADFLTSRGVRT